MHAQLPALGLFQFPQDVVPREALPEKYYRDWHLPGARHLPHDAVDALAPKVLTDRSAEIVVYCASRGCQNSHIAAHRLAQLGYENVAVYPGGKQDMEFGTLAIGAVLLWRYRFPFMLMPIAVTLWYMSMDLVPYLLGQERVYDWEIRKFISLWFGLAMTLLAFWVDLRSRFSRDCRRPGIA